jgi:hypothetical protein
VGCLLGLLHLYRDASPERYQQCQCAQVMGCTATAANYRSRSISFVRAIDGVIDRRVTAESVFSSKINIPARG